MKKIFKFQMKDIIIGFSVYALVILLLVGMTDFLSITRYGTTFSVTGIGFSGIIFCLVVGLGIYKEHCQMAVLNNVSRKDFFRSTLCITVILSFLCALLDLAYLTVNPLTRLFHAQAHAAHISNMASILYPKFTANNTALLTTFVNFILSFLINASMFILGNLFAGIYCRMPKKYRTIYVVILLCFGCGISPILFIAGVIFPGCIQGLMRLFLYATGISGNNPFLGMLTFTLAAAVISYICYHVLRRTEIS